jgi:hypothetical protein
MGASFKLQPGDGGPRYDGPHGPMTLPADPAGDETGVQTPGGEAQLAWGMRRHDEDALREGVAARIGGRELVLRREGRELVLSERGAPLARVRRRAFGKVELERADGTALATFKPSLSGEVEDAAGPDDVALMLLLMASGAANALERRVPLLG